eukprot:scaffold11622_cov63-Phaeocystis_antarctica.AAC.3
MSSASPGRSGVAPVGSRGNSSLLCDDAPPPMIRGEGEVPPLSQARAERPSATLSASTRRVLGRNQLAAAARGFPAAIAICRTKTRQGGYHTNRGKTPLLF